MRLIDGDALLVEFDRREAEPEYQHEGEDWYCGLISGEELVMKAPTIKPDRSLWFRIGETCVDESKGFISAERAVEKIRKLLREGW